MQALAQLVERLTVVEKQTSNSRWFDSGKPEPNFVGEIRRPHFLYTRGIGGFFLV